MADGNPLVVPIDAQIAVPFTRRSKSCGALFGALAKAQTAYGVVTKNRKNTHLNTQYADMESVVNATRPALNANGLAITESSGQIDGEFYVVVTLGHESGEWSETWCPVSVIDSTNNKGRRTLNNMQEFGNSLAYSRRYAWQMATGVTSTDDDDGQSASRNRSNNGDRQPFTAGQQNSPPRRPARPEPQEPRQQHKPEQQSHDGQPSWANGMTPEAINATTTEIYKLDGGRSVAAIIAHVGIDDGAIEGGENPSTVIKSVLGDKDNGTMFKAMVNAVFNAAVGKDDPEQLDTDVLIERINGVDLAQTLSAFPPPG